MTALAAFLCRSGRYDPAAETRRMLEVQALYGTQAPEQSTDGGLALGSVGHHRRADAAPRRICGGHVWFMADLRLDHREDLAAALEAPAHSGDTDLAARAYEAWGTASFDRLRGDFAIVLYDTRSGTVTLARDPFGTAPLHVATQGRDVAIASMPKGLNALPFVAGLPDPEFMEAAIRSFSMIGDGTFWQGVQRILPGHFATIGADGTLRQTLYWDPDLPRLRLRDRRAYAEALGEKIDRAVASRLRDVDHVATHLSAGIDSSAVTASAARLLAQRGGHVTAFTAAPREGYDPGNPNLLVDESTYAAETAAMYPNVDHVIWRPGPDWTTNAIEDNFRLTDTPAANICNLTWIHGINDAARDRGLRVLLNGQFGNLAMSQSGQGQAITAMAQGDYIGFLTTLWALRGLGRAQLREITRNALLMYGPGPIRRRLTPHAANPGRGQLDNDITTGQGRIGLLLSTIRRIDLGLHVKGTLAGWGIDTRDPTSDRDLVEFALSVPVGMNVHKGSARAVIRETMRGQMSETARTQTRKGIQAADWHEGAGAHMGWMREQLDAMRDHDTVRRVVDTDRLTALLDDWPTEGWHRRDTALAYRSALLRGISIGHFLRRASGSNR